MAKRRKQTPAERDYSKQVYCSLCDYELHTNDTNFCPNCGADMRGEQDG